VISWIVLSEQETLREDKRSSESRIELGARLSYNPDRFKYRENRLTVATHIVRNRSIEAPLFEKVELLWLQNLQARV
jgi:hypothetical protein